jgi:WD40 repeat protein
VTASRCLIVAGLGGLLLALAGSALSARATATTTVAGGPRILFECGEAYSILPDGSRLTPVVPRALRLTPLALSGDRRTVAYTNQGSESLYVSRANGTALRRLGRFWGGPLALSRDGRLLALPQKKSGIWIVGTNGRGLRRLTSGREDGVPDWSPDGKSLVFRGGGSQQLVILRPLRGKQRLLARGEGSGPYWSPDGRWIAYGSNGLWLVRPDGTQRHRLVAGVSDFAWDPDGRRLALAGHSRRQGYRLGFVQVDGRGLRWLRLKVSPELGSPPWSPDGRYIAFAGRQNSDAVQMWVVHSNGRGLRRLTRCGSPVGWTRLSPALPPDPPQERVLGPTTLATRDPVWDLSADGSQVAVIAAGSPTQCGHVAVWTPGTSTFLRLGELPCGPVSYGLELAGTRAAWAGVEGCGNSCDVSLYTASVSAHTASRICDLCGNFSADEGPPTDFHQHGDGDLLVFNDTSQDATKRLVRVGGGSERCQDEPHSPAICTTLRRGAHAFPVDSVSGGLIAIREPDEVAVLDAQGALVREFPFLPDEVTAARLDGGRLVVARLAVIDVYDVATGARVLSQPLPSGFKLSDVDGGIALLRHGETIMLMRLDDARSRTFAPGQGPRFAELESSGLYYSYATGSEGRVVFVPRSDLF